MECSIVPGSQRHVHGFTLIELLVVLAIIAALLTLVSPNYFRHLGKAKETVLKENLLQTRDAIDKFVADTGKYPNDLQALVSGHYLRSLPLDPITDKTDSWQIIAPEPGQDGVADIKSGAQGKAQDGTGYQDW